MMDLQAKSYWLCLRYPTMGTVVVRPATLNLWLSSQEKVIQRHYLFEDYKTTTQRTAESFRQDAELANETGEKVNIIKLLLK